MKPNLLFITMAAVAVASSLHAQITDYASGPEPFGFYKALTLAMAQSDSSGGAAPEAKEDEDQGGLSQEELAKLAQNPVANLLSFPFQNNFNFGVGPNHVTQYVLNFQPVIPITLNDDWNLITRWILPTINQPAPAPGVRSAFGLGDFNPSFFLSPANPGKLIWGLGPTATFPTATDPLLGNGKYLVGPSAVALTIQGHWLIGVLVNNQWSVAGWGSKNQNLFLTQPFVNYNLPHGWYLTLSPIITADWNASHQDMWTVPVGGGFGKIVKLGGKLPINLQLAAYYNVVTPTTGADWQLRFQLQVLLPKQILSRL